MGKMFSFHDVITSCKKQNSLKLDKLLKIQKGGGFPSDNCSKILAGLGFMPKAVMRGSRFYLRKNNWAFCLTNSRDLLAPGLVHG